MKAVILVGGQGTRLRPLTVNTPKPLLPLVNRPFLDHILYLLRTHGITDVILAMAYLSDSFEEAYGDGSHLGMRLTYVHEAEPLGTAGAIKNVEGHLAPGESFLVFNGDVLTDLDLTGMLRFHKEHGSVCTISLTPVEDPSAFGVVDLNDEGAIGRFTEKPRREEATSNWINAGTYILEPGVLEHVPIGQFYMVERGLFPGLLHDGYPLFGYRSDAYWIDIGTPAKYLEAQEDLLSGRVGSYIPPEGENVADAVWAGEGTFIEHSATVTGPVVLGKGCVVGRRATILGPVVLGDGCQVGVDARLEALVAWRGARFDDGSVCNLAIVGTGARVGERSRLEGGAIVGDQATVEADNHLAAGAKLWPGKTLPKGTISF